MGYFWTNSLHDIRFWPVRTPSALLTGFYIFFPSFPPFLLFQSSLSLSLSLFLWNPSPLSLTLFFYHPVANWRVARVDQRTGLARRRAGPGWVEKAHFTTKSITYITFRKSMSGTSHIINTYVKLCSIASKIYYFSFNYFYRKEKNCWL